MNLALLYINKVLKPLKCSCFSQLSSKIECWQILMITKPLLCNLICMSVCISYSNFFLPNKRLFMSFATYRYCYLLSLFLHKNIRNCDMERSSAMAEPQIKTLIVALKIFFKREIVIFGSGLDFQLILKIVKSWFPWGLQATYARLPSPETA